MNSRKSKMLTIPCLNQLPPFISAMPSNTRPPSRRMKRRRCVLFPNIGNSVNSVTRGNVTGEPLPSVPEVPAALKQHGKTRDEATFLSATDRARLFGINKR
ncbi:hypothetical protein R3I94_006285 [Phoxinus phoxinus]